ncbi:penicillin-binding protein [Erysipelothrix sp. HDW6C]|uniref:transglycosylase domain-containing protein n=1 Tax=Erysipelothrix sp. HDW6C TaxID=2714930 RepID=UPI00140A6CA3|nr:transglycosylase domain-containing protein [Erysipelothrix sp. HDW6C]QIK69989.1 penicillin-binding protein [Erysipelothrix sp. HDW6C]
MTEKNDKTMEMKKPSNPKPTPKKKKPKGPHRGARIVASILIFITASAVLVTGVVGIYAANQISKTQNYTTEDFISMANSKIYAADGDEDGVEIHNAGIKKRENISYDELSTSLIDAFVATEDSRFFEHNGFDIPRFTKAAIENVLDSLKSGSLSFGQGGSTFTMQLIKNTVFMNDGSDGGEVIAVEGGSSGISRKVQEIYLAQHLESTGVLSKKLILELYLNRIDFGAGNNIVGVENSSQAYFGKSASDLNTVESAFMAGVINAPFAYSPYSSLKLANERTQNVLYLMHYHGYISDEEYELSKNVKIEDLLSDKSTGLSPDLPYQAYIDAVYKEVEDLTGLNPATTPMRIYTAMNVDVQESIDKVQNREVDYLNYDYGYDKPTKVQIGSAVVNNQTGEIIGTFGGYDRNAALLNDRATRIAVQPASTMKPVVSYAPAFEYLGWATDHIIEDVPIEANGLILKNYDDRYEGQIPLNRAIGDSRNIPAIKAFLDVQDTLGYDGYMKYFENLGLPYNEDNFGWPYAIGNDSFKLTPAQMAAATGALFNEGKYNKPHTVRRIEFEDGREPYYPDSTPTQALSPGAAYMATRGMKYVVDSNTNSYTQPLMRSYTTFGKTGTNEWDAESAAHIGVPAYSSKSRLMIAATDQFTIATWAGFDESDENSWFDNYQKDLNIPGELNSYLLDVLYDSYGPGYDLAVPGDVVQISHIKGPFPYQSPVADMDPELVSTGYILSKYAKLTEAKPQELLELASNPKLAHTQNGADVKLTVTMDPYPDETKVTASDNRDLTVTYPGGGTYTIPGGKIYDEAWIFGAVRYKSEVYVNGVLVEEKMDDKNIQAFDIKVDPTIKSEIKVVSYYTFDKSGKKSSPRESILSIEATKDNSVTAPSFVGRSLGEFMQWVNANKIPTPTVNYTVDNTVDYATIRSLTPDPSGKSYKPQELLGLKLTVDVSDYQISADGALTVGQFRQSFGTMVAPSNPAADDDKIITGFIFGGETVNSFRMSDRFGGSVTLKID